jgi:hypothetical protein
MIQYLPDLDSDTAPRVVRELIRQGRARDLAPDILRAESSRATFLAYPEDIKALTAEQMLALIPGADMLPYNAHGRELEMLQPTFHSVIVPSLRFKDGELCVFNCTHVLNASKMLAGINDIQMKCEAARYPATARLLSKAYRLQTMRAQCPRCMAQQLASYFEAH